MSKKNREQEIREAGRYWALKCKDGEPHPGILFPDTLEGVAAITRSLLILDDAKPRCGSHVILELIERP